MTMQFLKIGNKYVALDHIRCVAVSPMETRVMVYLGENVDSSIVSLKDEEAKAFLEFMKLRSLDLTTDTATQEE